VNVDLLSYFGDDLMVVNAARVSYGKEKNTLDERDVKLLNYLVKHKHSSPFRHPQLQFRVKCPIYVERQLFKHQVGLSANSISGRYVDFSDSYSIPARLRKQSESSKQGSDGYIDEDLNSKLIEDIRKVVNFCSTIYHKMCKAGVAKEQARTVLPMCLATQFIWTGSLAAFLHMWNLRLKPDAQLETRLVAQEMLNLVKALPVNPFKYSLEAHNL